VSASSARKRLGEEPPPEELPADAERSVRIPGGACGARARAGAPPPRCLDPAALDVCTDGASEKVVACGRATSGRPGAIITAGGSQVVAVGATIWLPAAVPASGALTAPSAASGGGAGAAPSGAVTMPGVAATGAISGSTGAVVNVASASGTGAGSGSSAAPLASSVSPDTVVAVGGGVLPGPEVATAASPGPGGVVLVGSAGGVGLVGSGAVLVGSGGGLVGSGGGVVLVGSGGGVVLVGSGGGVGLVGSGAVLVGSGAGVVLVGSGTVLVGSGVVLVGSPATLPGSVATAESAALAFGIRASDATSTKTVVTSRTTEEHRRGD